MFHSDESGHAVAQSRIVARYLGWGRATLVALVLGGVGIASGLSSWWGGGIVLFAVAVDIGLWWARRRVKGLLSPELANAALDSVPALFFVLDQSGSIQYWNTRFAELSDIDSFQFYGQRLYNFFADADRQTVVVAVTRALTRGSSTVEARLAIEDGRQIPMLLTGIRVNLGGTYRLVGVGQDISARKEAEAQLREQEEKYRLLAENVTDVVTHLDPATNLRYVSPSVEPLLGYAPEELTGRRALDLVHPDDRADCVQAVRAAHEEGRRPRPEFRVRTKNEGYLWVESVGKFLPRENGRDDLIITTRDISTRKAREADLMQARDAAEDARKEAERARQDAEKANRLKSAFLANMSHEIRTPLTSVIGFSEVLEEELEEDHLRFARLIRQSSTRLKGVLDSVLRLSKLEVGVVEFDPEEIDLAAEVERTVDLLQPQAEEKDLALRVDIPETLPIYLDPGATGRILDNLVGNAIRYTPHGGTVQIRLQRDEDHIRLQVDDTGDGIDPELMPDLFEPFVQAAEDERRSDGSGLGLAITKRLVEGMDGDIEVDSELDSGTCFTVHLTHDCMVSSNGSVEPEGGG
ncbi:MAG: hypothetical protein BRD55_05165 [Bacteroidetes bacterium SW_9_63_38]|nr:MAG: hypothetical protein BRD55_05165 [Bacteroidetes bacterium SW_9_63_38]